MKSFVGLGLGLSLAALAFGAGCSSSPSSDGEPDSGTGNGADSGGLADTGAAADSGGGAADTGVTTDSGGNAQDAGSCAPGSLPDGGVPTFTAPALDQGICQASDISAFVTACGGSSVNGCAMWEQTNAASACGKCLFNANLTVAPYEGVVIGNRAAIGPGVGACILAASGSAAAGCAAAYDETDYCLNYVCLPCMAGMTSCIATATSASGVCAAAAGRVQTACASYASAVQACENGAGNVLSATANAICGSGATDGGADQ